VYNILRVYTPKTNVVKFDESTKLEKIHNIENFSKCSTRTLPPIEEKSLSNDCTIDQLEIECKVIDGQEKVVVFSYINFLYCRNYNMNELNAKQLAFIH
jgi:hypothetical protein